MNKAESSGGNASQVQMEPVENQIIVYQPDDMTRLSVRFDGETVWLSQEQMIDLFQRDRSVISRHIANAFKEGEVDKENCLHILQTNAKGRPEVVYNLEVVTSVGYRVKSLRGAFGSQCGKFTKTICGICHDRFIIVDQKEIFWTGASLKDAGRLTFAAAKMGAEVIPGLLESIHKATSSCVVYPIGKRSKKKRA